MLHWSREPGHVLKPKMKARERALLENRGARTTSQSVAMGTNEMVFQLAAAAIGFERFEEDEL